MFLRHGNGERSRFLILDDIGQPSFWHHPCFHGAEQTRQGSRRRDIALLDLEPRCYGNVLPLSIAIAYCYCPFLSPIAVAYCYRLQIYLTNTCRSVQIIRISAGSSKTALNHEKCCHTSRYLDLVDLGGPGNTLDCVGVRWSALENSMCVGVRWKPRNVRWCALEKSPNVRWSTLECVGLRWKSARLGRF